MENEKHRVDGMLIGEYVQKSIKRLFEEKRIHESELIKFQRQEYCKVKFDLNFPMLSKSNEPKERYYVNEITEGYYLTNDWYERNWDDFLKWENSKK